MKRAFAIGSAGVLLAAIFFAFRDKSPAEPDSARQAPPLSIAHASSPLELSRRGGMVHIPRGTFVMGSATADPADARPARRVSVDSFWLDAAPVTNDEFAEFVAAAEYKTTAERRGNGLVFDAAARKWQTVDGADWRRPHGPDSSIAGRGRWPVVQVSWYDAVAYARWAKKRLVTEAEYEYAARGGLADCDYPWGRELIEGGRHWANTWQGRFPDFNLVRDAHAEVSPVDAFPANRYGLVDMLGNVYSWCEDWYDSEYYDVGPRENPRGPQSGEQKVQRGGSWQSAANFEPLAVWRRRGADPNTTTNHVGFHCASDEPPADETTP